MFKSKKQEDAMQLIKSRRSIRNYKKEPVADDLIQRVLEAGVWAPSSNHCEPVEFIVVKNETKKNELSKLSSWSGFLKEAPVNIAVIVKDSNCELEDGSAAVMNMMIEAHSLGLGTCWIDCQNSQEYIKDTLDIPGKYRVITILPLGYPNEKAKAKRQPVEEKTHSEKY